MNSVVDRLLEARNEIADPRYWTQHSLFRGPNGYSSPSGTNSYWPHEKHESHCARGILVCAVRQQGSKSYMDHEGEKLLVQAAQKLYSTHELMVEAGPPISGSYAWIVRVNNWLGHEATLAMFDEAIKLAKESG